LDVQARIALDPSFKFDSLAEALQYADRTARELRMTFARADAIVARRKLLRSQAIAKARGKNWRACQL
jgi:hypothetical protein